MIDAQLLDAFHLMYDHYPESVMLINQAKEIMAVNPVAAKEGRTIGGRCSALLPLEKHQGCQANQAFQTRHFTFRKKKGAWGDVISFWLPVDGYPDYLIHFSVGSTQKYDVTI